MCSARSNFGLLREACTRADASGLRWHAGGIVSSDVFYHGDGLAYYDALRAHGVLAVEMETSALYTLAVRHGARALSICAMSDCLVTAAELSAAERQSSPQEMVRLALDVAVGA